MKKLIITTGIVLAASFTFYVHESGSLSNSITVLSQTTNYENILGLGLTGNNRLDIGQADVK